MKDIAQIQEDAEKRHKEVIDMIEALSDTTGSDRASSVHEFHFSERIK
jgi:alpha-D-ribose 1-methylphosphonate 5-triphosphate diphosphatase PhnM